MQILGLVILTKTTLLLILFTELPEWQVNASDAIKFMQRFDEGELTNSQRKLKNVCRCKCPFNKSFIKQCPAPPIPTPSTNGISGGNIPQPLHVNGIFPSLTAKANSGPTRTECGIGALMPWADKLYMVSYLSSYGAGGGTGLYAIDENFYITTLVNHTSTYANRMIHPASNKIIIGAWAIDMEGNITQFNNLLKVRIAATAEHLTHPQTMVYMLGMDGPLWECNVTSLACTQIFDLVKELNIPSSSGEQPHFKAAHTMNGRLVVATNTFDENDFIGKEHGGRLAEWKGPGQNWTIIDTNAYVEVTGRHNFGQVIYALGWDYRSVILKVFDPEVKYWQTYRLPKGSHAFDHLWQTEWPRIREVETERYLMDMHGIFYELSPLGWVGSTWGIRPISQHLRVIPDFASYRGFLVLGGNQVSSIADNNLATGQAQSGLWFGKTDDLWSFGKPKGWGAVWRTDDLANGSVSDPYLMTGFDKKVLHVINHEQKSVTVFIEIDITGAAGHRANETWLGLKVLDLSGEQPYMYYIFEEGYSAHWVRTRLSCPLNPTCKMTAYFHYT